MSESRFIKTVTFGGFDKNDVNKKLNSLYKQIYDLKNELRETRLTVEKYKNGSDEEKAHESVLSTERAKLTELQVENESVSEKLKESCDELRKKDEKISQLEKKNQELEKTIKDIRTELEGLKSTDDAGIISTVFIEAQKSAELIKASAKEKADETEEKAKRISENTVKDANNTAARIIYEAEKKAAEIEADALNKAEEIKVSCENLRAEMAEDIKKIYIRLSELRTNFEAFSGNGFSLLDNSENFLKNNEKNLLKDGTPVFRTPEHIEPEYPDEPVLIPVDHNYETEEKPEITPEIKADEPEIQDTTPPVQDKEPETQNDSEENSVQELQDMASAPGIEESQSEPVQPENIDDTRKQDNPEQNPEKNEKKKSGGIDLDALMKQAAALDD